MTRSILRPVLTTLALVLLFAGSFNLNRTSANEVALEGISCTELGGCQGGPCLCAVIVLPDGTVVKCGMACERESG